MLGTSWDLGILRLCTRPCAYAGLVALAHVLLFSWCLQFEPKSRPSFSEIVRKLEAMVRGKCSPERALSCALPPGVAAEMGVSVGVSAGSSLAARSVEVIPSTSDDSKTSSRHKKREC